MAIQSLKMKVAKLQKKHPRFVYKSFAHRLHGSNFEISFEFFLEPNVVFHPKVAIKGVNPANIRKIPKQVLDNLVFHLGLAEIPSYWKCAVSPVIAVECGTLDTRQIAFWKNLIMQGLGEFFYRNRINPYGKNFLKIVTAKKSAPLPPFVSRLPNRFLVPVGGGKDSLVGVEVLKQAKQEFRTLVLGNVPAAFAASKASSTTPPVHIRREIDKKLFELNQKGYLNGHTPFSAYLAFLSVTCATLFGYRHVAVSNERSSNEENVRYRGRNINHQYSKSFDFEKKFRAYAKRYVASSVNYFSLLRPLYELQIASLFAQFPKYLPTFKSCNVLLKKNAWCGRCAKCVSVYLLLIPFVGEKKLVRAFRQNILNNPSNWHHIPAMLGLTRTRPFDCIGTKLETYAALCLAIEKYETLRPALLAQGTFHFTTHIRHARRDTLEVKSKKMPLLLQRALRELKLNCNDPKLEQVLTAWNSQNFVPKDLAKVLKKFASSENDA